ncbi:hypothetical protein A2X44_01730 [candidate division CPR3 bacterium GWF2_35_18]|uniref:Prolipoprotein diacylglyceryl transferase n=1 Tax=candidate division CPR3 bacterium GW2011_GWF2_35_18 TaxID=1618350 RepID=A0A0G0E3L4_UNCC3|nr:MAG: Prolipoprotein diacylglyceryl transferase [candidate division CPR3 bacterium GW2011_GWF2_35_18]KKP85716.1 MAG: Prolipoprotein diacylglyceryl transferase [candidate division CPR3 bacterium GW2011_GWE2_35_7]OGB62720.1 MAG: hypothetical protein A2X44_01730 [candidate division CPR3 bacterium GWF2_35_18]OGB65746.1 MAG: hypothetical protein A2250_01990 [candidate division CPR3 bacterium RIFOXYA2_FULL_35_13]OGB79039.1 MAG: hypothetical protein A2296_02435 [candidate division CPR3 bacterium RIF
MYPILLRFGPVTIYSYGLCLALAFLLGTFVIWQESHRKGFDEEKVLDFVLISIFGSIFLGRIVFIILNWSLFANNVHKVLYFWEIGGINVLGLAFGALLAGILYLKKKRWPVLMTYDFFVLGLLLAQILERIGFFLSSSGFGKMTSFFLGVQFPGEIIKRHPVALYEAFLLLPIFILFYLLYRKCQKRENYKEGLIATLYLIVMGLMTIGTAFLTKNMKDKEAITLTLIPVGLIILSSFVIFYIRSGRNLKNDLKLFSNLFKPRKNVQNNEVGIEKLVESTKKLETGDK